MTPYLVVKIGGKPASNLSTLDLLLENLADMGRLGFKPILVHGGGADVTELSRRLGIEPTFVVGKRQTSPEEMDLVDMALAGLVNTRILRRATALGIRAVGLSGVDAGLCSARPVDLGTSNRTGTIGSVRPGVVHDLSQMGYIPVVSSVSMNEQDQGGLNLNADDMAMALAIELRAEALVFLSDIPGIKDDDKVLSQVNRSTATDLIASGVITGGMIPKVQGALEAVDRGVGAVIIGGFDTRGDLEAFMARTRGTTINKG